jgi:hypothetical protein
MLVNLGLTYPVANIYDYLRIVEKCKQEWFVDEQTWGPWFRGQSDACWPLRPTMYRYLPLARDVRAVEDELRQEFAVRAPNLCPERPQNSWEWYFLMQHSGAPTRLLDWTESALIALFFAVKSRGSRTDAAVWILEPWKLNECVAKIDEVVAPSANIGMVTSHADRYAEWLPDRYSNTGKLKKRLPVALYPVHFSRRISSQRSCFTAHGSDLDGFDHLPRRASRFIRKVVIPAGKIREIESSLAVFGVDELTIYPDLDGLGRWLTSILREESWAPNSK